MEVDHACNQCEKTFSSKGNLNQHVKAVHEGIKPYICAQCGYRTARKSDLHKHLPIHTGQKPYQCETCSVSFSFKRSLDRHVKEVHECLKTHTCPQCGYRTAYDEKPYQCETCDKAFAQRGDLKRHVMIHEGVKPYACDQCKKRFTQRGNLKQHMRTHTGERPHSCVNCWQSFSQVGSFNRHLKKCNNEDVHIDSDSGVYTKTSVSTNAAFATAQQRSIEPHLVSEDSHTINISDSPQGQLVVANNLMFDRLYSFEVKQEDIL